MKILAAETSDAMRQTLREVIEVLGHQAVEASNAKEVLTALTAHHPELALVVLQWELPGSDGLGLLRRVLADERFRSIPVMVILDPTCVAQAIDAFQAGAAECVSRAVNQQDLLTRMMECLGRAA